MKTAFLVKNTTTDTMIMTSPVYMHRLGGSDEVKEKNWSPFLYNDTGKNTFVLIWNKFVLTVSFCIIFHILYHSILCLQGISISSHCTWPSSYSWGDGAQCWPCKTQHRWIITKTKSNHMVFLLWYIHLCTIYCKKEYLCFF